MFRSARSSTFNIAPLDVNGFYDGNGTYKLRFMPDTQANGPTPPTAIRAELNNKTGNFLCTAPPPHTARSQSATSTTSPTPTARPTTPSARPATPGSTSAKRSSKQTRSKPSAPRPSTRSACASSPSTTSTTTTSRRFYPFERNAAGINDFTRPNPAFFAPPRTPHRGPPRPRHRSRPHPLPPLRPLGLCPMPPEADDRYLRYVVARLAAYRNVWWSLANEFDFMKHKATDRLGPLLPHRRGAATRLTTCARVHNGNIMYDYCQPWVTHVSLQTSEFREKPSTGAKPAQARRLTTRCTYEGNINAAGATSPAKKMVRRFWLGTIAGRLCRPRRNLSRSSTTSSGGRKAACCTGKAPRASPSCASILNEAAARAGLESNRSILSGRRANPAATISTTSTTTNPSATNSIWPGRHLQRRTHRSLEYDHHADRRHIRRQVQG